MTGARSYDFVRRWAVVELAALKTFCVVLEGEYYDMPASACIAKENFDRETMCISGDASSSLIGDTVTPQAPCKNLQCHTNKAAAKFVNRLADLN